MTDRYSDALLFAARAHYGQKDDWDGAPYMHHVLAVAAGARHGGEIAEIVALLHDVVEHADVTLPQIEDRFGPEIARSVDAMSKRKGEDFFGDYMPRVLADPVAVIVKRADVRANAAKAAQSPDAGERERYTRKYQRALGMLGV